MEQTFPTYRPIQSDYAAQVTDLLETGGKALLEAPCGIGKSIGYLRPALEHSNSRTIVATQQNEHLDQIRHTLMDYAVPGTWAVLKGHQEYWCQPHAYDLPEELQQYEAAIEAWLSTTDTGELSSLPIPKHLHKQLQTKNDDCHEEDCRYAIARDRANAARVILMTHAGLLTRHRHHVLEEMMKDEDEATNEITSLILDELHLVRGAVDTAYGTDVDLAPGITIPKEPRHVDEHQGYFAAVENAVEESLREWRRLRILLVCKYLWIKLTAKEVGSILDDIDDDSLPLCLTKEQESVSRLLNIVYEICSARGKDETAKVADRYGINIKHIKEIKNIKTYHRKQQACEKACEILSNSVPSKKLKGWKDTAICLNDATCVDYIDIKDQEIKILPAYPNDILHGLYDEFSTVVGTSGTIISALDSCLDADITRYPSLYDMEEAITSWRIPSNELAHPPSATDNYRTKGRLFAQRHQYIAQSIAKHLETKPTIIALVTSIEHASILYDACLSQGIANVYVESSLGLRDGNRMGLDEMSQTLSKTGGVGIMYTWHGSDVRSDQEKMLIIERYPNPPPGRQYAALQMTRTASEVHNLWEDAIECRIQQGLGRAIRGPAEKCSIALLDRKFGVGHDPRKKKNLTSSK